MPSYDARRFAPPAPVAHVTLRSANQSAEVRNIPMLLDTGADVTMVPSSVVEDLGVQPASAATFKLVGFDGSPSEASAVQLELIFSRRTFRGRFLLVDQDWGILGRNVLNLLPILLDGPRLTWTLPATPGA